MADYIPDPDGGFDAWQETFFTYLEANAAALGVAPADVTALEALQTAWTQRYAAHGTAQASAQSATEAKDAARLAYEESIRAAVAGIQARLATTNEQREALGITPRDDTRTPSGPVTTRPVGMVDMAQRLRHTISFRDEAKAGRGKPVNAVGCEIWMKVGDPAPVGPDDVSFLALDTRSPYEAEFDQEDGGKTVYYLLRWLAKDGSKGPWSETVSATVAR